MKCRHVLWITLLGQIFLFSVCYLLSVSTQHGEYNRNDVTITAILIPYYRQKKQISSFL